MITKNIIIRHYKYKPFKINLPMQQKWIIQGFLSKKYLSASDYQSVYFSDIIEEAQLFNTEHDAKVRLDYESTLFPEEFSEGFFAVIPIYTLQKPATLDF